MDIRNPFADSGATRLCIDGPRSGVSCRSMPNLAPAKGEGLPEMSEEHATTFRVTSRMLKRGFSQSVGTSAAREAGRHTQTSLPPAYDSQTGRRLSVRAIAAAVIDDAGTVRAGRQPSTIGQQRRRTISKLLLHRKWSM